jgi:VWFA-related protein
LRRVLSVVACLVVVSCACVRAMVWAQESQSGSGSDGAKPGSAATGASTAPQPGAAPTIQVISRETVVDITATDGKGQPIHGLKDSDFTVKEDGKVQPLRSFREVREDLPPAVTAPPKLPDHVYANIQPPPTTSAVNILLLDGLNTLPLDQMNMREESLKYLKSMPRGTRIAVLGLTSSLRILQGFTSDPSVLIAAVDTKKNRALPSPFIDSDSGGILDDEADAQTELGNDDTAAAIQEFSNEQAAVQQDIRTRMTLEALDQIAAYVSGIKGRKNLIWFTDGMPLNIYPTGGVADMQGMTDYNKEVRQTTDLLNAAEVAVYPVDARKLFTDPSNDASQHLERITVNTSTRLANANLKTQVKNSSQLLGMEAVAEGTGGVAYYNTNYLKTAVAKAIANGSNYYSISYAPPDPKFDGRYHSIDISVNRPDAHLSYRKGYNADDIVHNEVNPELSLVTPDGSTMRAAMARGVPTSSQVLFDVRVAPTTDPPKATDPPVIGALDPKLAGKPVVRYDVLFVVPPRQLTFPDVGDGTHKVALEFDIAAYDVYGKLISSSGRVFSPPPLNAEQYQRFLRDKPPFFQQIDLPAGETFLRVGVLDKFSDRTGTLEIPLVVSKKLAKIPAPPGGTAAP